MTVEVLSRLHSRFDVQQGHDQTHTRIWSVRHTGLKEKTNNDGRRPRACAAAVVAEPFAEAE